MNRQAQSRLAFLKWMKSYSPIGYKKLMLSLEREGLSDATSGGFWANITDTFQKILPTITQSVAQAKIFRAQMKRAERGMPPLKTAEYAPTMRIQANIGAETRNAIMSETGGMLKTYMLPGMLILGGGLLYMMLRRR